MSLLAYIDTSAFLALCMRQGAWTRLQKTLRKFERLISSDLLICEASSAYRRENIELEKLKQPLASIDILSATITPDVVERVLQYEFLRGADVHHLATALWFFDPLPEQKISERSWFVSFDAKQNEVAEKLGFITLQV